MQNSVKAPITTTAVTVTTTTTTRQSRSIHKCLVYWKLQTTAEMKHEPLTTKPPKLAVIMTITESGSSSEMIMGSKQVHGTIRWHSRGQETLKTGIVPVGEILMSNGIYMGYNYSWLGVWFPPKGSWRACWFGWAEKAQGWNQILQHSPTKPFVLPASPCGAKVSLGMIHSLLLTPSLFISTWRYN